MTKRRRRARIWISKRPDNDALFAQDNEPEQPRQLEARKAPGAAVGASFDLALACHPVPREPLGGPLNRYPQRYPGDVPCQ